MDTRTEIKNTVNDNEVCLYMKGVPEAPQCGFSMAVSNILKLLKVNFKAINVLENEEIAKTTKLFYENEKIRNFLIKKYGDKISDAMIIIGLL